VEGTYGLSYSTGGKGGRGRDREGVGREDGRHSGKEWGVREGWWREEERWRKSERIRGRRGSEERIE
jgi:hypothetical protein